jgi:hypothetical protein
MPMFTFFKSSTDSPCAPAKVSQVAPLSGFLGKIQPTARGIRALAETTLSLTK